MLPRLTVPWLGRGTSRSRTTDAVAQPGRDWVLPYWLERQLDPRSPANVAAGDDPYTNVTHRNWTAVGNLDSPQEAVVDPRGLVTPWFDGWSLDWWIGAEDRWYIPAREVAVRQRLVEASPVVETAMRIPGGDAVQSVYAVQRSSHEGGGELVIVEVENRSKVPVALALAVRPYHHLGLSMVDRVDLRDQTTVTVDGLVALWLPKPPPRCSVATFDQGDSAATVTGGNAGQTWPGAVHCAAGRAQAAFVYPLAHGASMRVALPLGRPGSARGRQRARAQVERTQTFPTVVPAPADVARGWVAQTRRGLRLELPDGRLSEAVDANRRFLLLLHDRDEAPAARSRFPFRDVAHVVHALDCYGFHEEATQLLVPDPDRLGGPGLFSGQHGTRAVNGAVLWALVQHWYLTQDRELVEAMVGPIAEAVQRVQRARRSGRKDTTDRSYEDDLWGVAGLRAGAELLGTAGQPAAAKDVARFAAALWADVERSLALPAGRRRLDAEMVGSLVASWPLGLIRSDDSRIVATLDTVRERFTLADGRAVVSGVDPTGLDTHLTMRLAGVELLAGDRRCLERLSWLLDVATPTWTWPEAIHPDLQGGCGGDGHSGQAAAELLRFVRHLLVRETQDTRPEGAAGTATSPPGGGLALTTLVPEAWLGQGWEVHDAPTAFGRLSYAVRWHGDRPALLWDLQPHERDETPSPAAGKTVRLTAPGLDPSWSTTEPNGEALLPPATTTVVV